MGLAKVPICYGEFCGAPASRLSRVMRNGYDGGTRVLVFKKSRFSDRILERMHREVDLLSPREPCGVRA